MKNNKKVIRILDEFVDSIDNVIKDLLIEESLDKVRTSDGRKVNAPACCKKGSFIYFYMAHDEIIYIGETGQAIKTGCIQMVVEHTLLKSGLRKL